MATILGFSGIDVVCLGCRRAGYVAIEMRRFKRVSTDITNMDNAIEPQTDGGQPRDREQMEEHRTSGGAVIGGAIAGAALGSSFGPGAAVFGAVVGAIIGDEMEKGVY